MATLVPQARQARASDENLNYTTLAPQARPSGKILNYLLSHYSDILYMILKLAELLVWSAMLECVLCADKWPIQLSIGCQWRVALLRLENYKLDWFSRYFTGHFGIFYAQCKEEGKQKHFSPFEFEWYVVAGEAKTSDAGVVVYWGVRRWIMTNESRLSMSES